MGYYDPTRPRANPDRKTRCVCSVWQLIEEAPGRMINNNTIFFRLHTYEQAEIEWALDELQRVGKIVCMEEGYSYACDPTRPRARHRDEPDDTNPELVDRFANGEQGLLSALGKIERKQVQLDEARQEFKQLLDSNPKLAEIWQRFERNGGATTEQLMQFLRGEMRPGITRRVGNLRLISDRPEAKKIVTYRRWNDDGDSGPNNAA